jgi:hypothetical protein
MCGVKGHKSIRRLHQSRRTLAHHVIVNPKRFYKEEMMKLEFSSRIYKFHFFGFCVDL